MSYVILLSVCCDRCLAPVQSAKSNITSFSTKTCFERVNKNRISPAIPHINSVGIKIFTLVVMKSVMEKFIIIAFGMAVSLLE